LVYERDGYTCQYCGLILGANNVGNLSIAQAQELLKIGIDLKMPEQHLFFYEI